MAKLISKTYGDALFELGKENSLLDDLYNEMKIVKSCVLESKEFLNLINQPKITKEEKKKIMRDTFEGKLSKEMIGFLLIVLEKDRFNSIEDILDYFEASYKEYKKIGVVYITSASDLSKSQKDKIEKKLLATTKYESFEAHYNVDKEIIAGVKIRIGDKVVDGSVKTRIDQMSKRLYNI